MDEEGYLYIVDRRSDLIISGGENIYPAEIENVLAGHPKILEAGVCGKEDAEWGSVPVAFVVVSGEVTEEELTAILYESILLVIKCRKNFDLSIRLPRNASNKLLRRELRQWVDFENEMWIVSSNYQQTMMESV